ncbi:MAG TPA: formate dehydrogenase subunit gamma [Aliidongia sp.]|nr:formate dehydrogenase subunit gamma [Aliidongia sp.]
MGDKSPWDPDLALDIIGRYRNMPGAGLPMLHALQDEFGYVDPAAVPMMAKALNLSQAEIHGVITFYHDFKTKPGGQRKVKLCRAEACQSMGCRDLEAHVKARLGVDYGGTTLDRRYTLEAAYCLGNCALSPALMIDDELYGRVDADRFDEILTETGGQP